MSPPRGEADRALEPALVSTGSLPTAAQVEALVAEAHERYREDASGATSSVYPALARADPGLFGVCVIGMSGNVYGTGDTEVEFSIMSVAKPFVFALVCDLLGPDEVWRRIGVNSTGLPFDSLAAVERSADGRTNPMVNSGAIATTSLLPGATPEDKWHFLSDGLSRFAARSLSIADDVYRSASETNMRNRSIAFLLRARDRIYCDPLEALDLYTRQSSLSVTARDLAVMGATLADGGVNPITGEHVINASSCRQTLAVMTTAGLYETSGNWLYKVGLPAKSGIGGGIVAVSPGKGGLGTFAPLLDGAGNSVKGQLAARFLSHRLGLHILASAPLDGLRGSD
jgi:glutaminase